MVWGLLFGGVGGIIGMVLLMDGQWLGGLFGSLFPLIGFSVLFFTYRRAARRKQLLREGRLADAWIQSLEPTNLYVNNQRRYRLGLRLALPTGEEHRSVSIYGPLVRRAEDRLSGNEPMQVLYVPDHPERFVLVDSLLPAMPAIGMM